MKPARQLTVISSVISVLFILMMAFLFHIGNNLASRQAPLIDATLDIRLEIKSIYIRVEETLLQGSTVELVESYNDSLQEAEWYLNAVLYGDHSEEGEFFPIQDETTRQAVLELQSLFAAYKSVTGKLIKASAARPGELKSFKELYQQMMLVSHHTEQLIQQEVRSQLGQYRIIGALLIGLSIIGAVLMVAYLRRQEKYRSKLISSLSDSRQSIIQKNKVLDNLAYFDQLTGLPNRTLLETRLSQAIERSLSQQSIFVLLFIDLDHFKQINDRYGHHIGDLLLSKVAERIRGNIREGDFAGRISGDEFAVILYDLQDIETADKCARQVAKKLLSAFQQSFQLEEYTITVTTSIGIALYPQDADNQGELLKASDKAMYQAKLNGKDKYQFYAGL